MKTKQDENIFNSTSGGALPCSLPCRYWVSEGRLGLLLIESISIFYLKDAFNIFVVGSFQCRVDFIFEIFVVSKVGWNSILDPGIISSVTFLYQFLDVIIHYFSRYTIHFSCFTSQFTSQNDSW